MEVYTTSSEVDIHEVDFNGIARPSIMMQYMQTAAQNQLTRQGMSYDELRGDHHVLFLLSKMKMEFYSPLRAYERVVAETFPCDSKGYTFLRCYRLLRGEELIGRAISAWALVNSESRALIRVDDFALGLRTYSPLDMSLGRTVVPREIEDVGEYTVRYADVDQNGHMNNTKYPDMFANFLPMKGRRMKSISIDYKNEAPAFETLKVQRIFSDGIYYFRTLRPDGKVNTVAEIELCDID